MLGLRLLLCYWTVSSEWTVGLLQPRASADLLVDMLIVTLLAASMNVD